ncbi:MAG: hypothetical protein RR493_01635 [Erysipelotrichaceae bacterium]
MNLETIKKEQAISLTKQTKVHQQSTLYAILRLVVFVGILFGIFLGYDKKIGFGYLTSLIACIIFIILYIKHQKIKNQQLYEECYQEVLLSFKMRWNQTWNTFKEMGNEFELDSKSEDLDLIHKASLYQYVSCATTPIGKRKLYEAITVGDLDVKQLNKKQNAIKECIEKEPFSIQLQVYLFKMRRQKGINEEKMNQLLNNLETYKSDISLLYRFTSIVFPIIMLIIFILVMFFNLNSIYIWMFFILQLLFSFLYKNNSDDSLSSIFLLSQSLQGYEEIFQLIQQESFKSEELKAISNCLKQGTIGIHKLNTFIGFVNVRLSPITYFVFSGLFMVDTHLTRYFNTWCNEYGKQVRTWVEEIANMEVYLSLSNIAFSKEVTCFPTFVEQEKPLLKMEGLRHPLIKESLCIDNNYSCDQSTCIITGSNMSGKTTFMRSIGVNMALALAGSPVCATHFTLTPLSVFTSMRIVDDVEHGISTFYGEILRIKGIMEASSKQQKMLVLIDEIFKGTNSADRIIGAKEAIHRLQKPWILSFVTTHDFELCGLDKEKDMDIVNYHFNEYYESDEIHFDYKIKEGRCLTTNALQLMKMAGIL